MAQPDSSATTGAAGDVVATQTVAGKEFQVVMLSDISGHIIGSKPCYIAYVPNQVAVAVANTVHWDLFNADATAVVRVLSIRQIPDIVTAVGGVAFDWLLERSTAVGTGGTVITPWLPDLSQPALDADITMRSKPTGGATAGIDLFAYKMHSEETNTTSIQIALSGGLEIVPQQLRTLGDASGPGIVLRQNQGIRMVQVTNSAAAWTSWIVVFVVD